MRKVLYTSTVYVNLKMDNAIGFLLFQLNVLYLVSAKCKYLFLLKCFTRYLYFQSEKLEKKCEFH